MVHLSPMQETDLQAYLEETIPAYADDKIRAGNWSPDEALERSRKEYEKLLPEGVNSLRQYLYNIVATDEDVTVGMLWFSVIVDTPHPYAFIYELQIFDAYQRKGYGKQAMLALEVEVRKLRLDTISLHVFGHNLAARALYDQLGYEITNINMSKKL